MTDQLLIAAKEALATLEHHQADIWPGMGDMQVVKMLRDAIALEQRPNRVVVEVEDNVVQLVRAERPDELVVFVHDRDLGHYYNRQHTVQKLNSVKEEA
jgi:hypothetical protein